MAQDQFAADSTSGDLSARIRQMAEREETGPTAPPLTDDFATAVAAAVSRVLPAALAAALPAAVQQAFTRTDAGEIEPRLSALEDVLEDIADRLEALTRDGSFATMASLDTVREQLSTLQAEIGGQQEEGSAEIDALRVDLADALDYVRAAAESRAEPGDDADAASPAGEGGAAPDWVVLHDIRARLDSLADTTADQIVEEGERQTAIVSGAVASAVTQAVTEGVNSNLTGAVAREVETLRVDVADALDFLRQRVEEKAGDTVDRVVAELLEMRTDLATTGAETLTDLAALRQLAGEAGVSLTHLHDGQTTGTDDVVSAVLAARAETQQQVEEQALAADQGSASVLDALNEVNVELAALGTHVVALSAVVTELRTSTNADRRIFLETAEDLAQARAALEGLDERLGVEVRSAAVRLEDASTGALAGLRTDVERAIGDLRVEMSAAHGSLDQHAEAVLGAVEDEARRSADDAFGSVRAALTEQLAQVGTARTEMALVAERVQAAGRLLVGYLGSRDAALEEVRDRVTVQLLADVLDGLSRKDRARAGETVRTRLGRRRDTRHAELYRTEHGEGPPPAEPLDERQVLAALDRPPLEPSEPTEPDQQAMAPDPAPGPAPDPAPDTAPGPAPGTAAEAAPGPPAAPASEAPRRPPAGRAKAAPRKRAATGRATEAASRPARSRSAASSAGTTKARASRQPAAVPDETPDEVSPTVAPPVPDAPSDDWPGDRTAARPDDRDDDLFAGTGRASAGASDIVATRRVSRQPRSPRTTVASRLAADLDPDAPRTTRRRVQPPADPVPTPRRRGVGSTPVEPPPD